MRLADHPFADRDRLVAWEARNCDRCSKSWTEDAGYACPIQLALRCAFPGPVPAEVIADMGYHRPALPRPWFAVGPCRVATRIAYRPAEIGTRRTIGGRS